jgi:hypothetical protein
MTDTRERVAEHVVPSTNDRGPRPTGLDESISLTAAVAAGLAWIVFVSLSFAVQPPVDPATPPSAMGEVLSLLFTGSMLAAIAGLGARHRWGLLASIGGGLVMVAASVFCYLGGHTGAWIAVQLAAGVGLALTSLGLLRAS